MRARLGPASSILLASCSAVMIWTLVSCGGEEDLDRPNGNSAKLFLRVAWSEVWEPGLPRLSRQLLVYRSTFIQYVRCRDNVLEGMDESYLSPSSYTALEARIMTSGFFDLRGKYVKDREPNAAIVEGNPPLVTLEVTGQDGLHTVIAQAGLEPEPFRQCLQQINRLLVEELTDSGCEQPIGTFMTAIPVDASSEPSVVDGRLFATLSIPDLKCRYVREMFVQPYRLIWSANESKGIPTWLGKEQHGVFYPFAKVNGSLFRLEAYYYNGKEMDK